MKEIFNFSDNKNCNLRSGTHLSRSIVHKTHYRTESTASLGAKILELVPQNIKEGNGFQKIARVVFVRQMQHKFYLFECFAKSSNACLIGGVM